MFVHRLHAERFKLVRLSEAYGWLESQGSERMLDVGDRAVAQAHRLSPRYQFIMEGWDALNHGTSDGLESLKEAVRKYPDDPEYTPAATSRAGADPDAVAATADLLLEADEPVVFAGQGVHYAGDPRIGRRRTSGRRWTGPWSWIRTSRRTWCTWRTMP